MSFIPVSVSGNVCVFSSISGDIIFFTIVENGLMRINNICKDGYEGEAYIDIARFEDFNYNCSNPKEELVKYVFERMKALNQTKTYISGNFYTEVCFVINKKISCTSLKVRKIEQSKKPTQFNL